ncbi:MAG: hypothetical protein ACRDZN_11060 [Acidimicrobiales bacterium]
MPPGSGFLGDSAGVGEERFLHMALLQRLGMPIGERWALEAPAAVIRR